MRPSSIALALALSLCAAPVLAQSTAAPVVTGYLTTSNCAYGQTTCFVQYGANGPTLANVNVTQFGGNNVVTGTGAGGLGIPRFTVSNDSTLGLVAGTAIVGKVGIDQTTPGVTNGVQVNAALPAGANLIGSTIGYGTVVSADLTRPNNTTTYTANTAWANATSGATYTTFTGVCRANGTVVLMPSVRIIDYANQTTKLQGILWLFSTAPGTIINDNAAFNLAAADVANMVAVPLSFTESTVANATAGSGGTMLGALSGTTYEVKCANADTNIYAMVEVTNAYVPVASEKLTIALKVVGVN